MPKKKTTSTWSDVKAALNEFDRAGLIALVQDLYAANTNNQNFLHTRFSIGDDPLKPYKEIISRWVCPDVMRNQNLSVSTAKKAISDYKKAIGRPEGVAELSTHYCEEVFTFFGYCGVEDESYYASLVRMFEQALKATMTLPEPQRHDFLKRLKNVRAQGQQCGWGVGTDFNSIWEEAGLNDET